MEGVAEDWFTANKAKRPRPFWSRMAHSLNPVTWFASQKGKVDTGQDCHMIPDGLSVETRCLITLHSIDSELGGCLQ